MTAKVYLYDKIKHWLSYSVSLLAWDSTLSFQHLIGITAAEYAIYLTEDKILLSLWVSGLLKKFDTFNKIELVSLAISASDLKVKIAVYSLSLFSQLQAV